MGVNNSSRSNRQRGLAMKLMIDLMITFRRGVLYSSYCLVNVLRASKRSSCLLNVLRAILSVLVWFILASFILHKTLPNMI
jgi:hypothetical protein